MVGEMEVRFQGRVSVSGKGCACPGRGLAVNVRVTHVEGLAGLEPQALQYDGDALGIRLVKETSSAARPLFVSTFELLNP